MHLPCISPGDKIQFMASQMEYDALTIGTLVPGGDRTRQLSPKP